MPMEGTAVIAFFSNEPFDAADLVDTTTDVLIDVGASIGDGGGGLVESGNGSIETNISISDRRVRIRLYPGSKGTIPNPFVSLSTDEDNIRPDTAGDDYYEGFPADLVNVIKHLTADLEPIFVSSFNTAHATAGPAPELVTPSEVPLDIERVPWLGIYSETVLEQFGGPERVLGTPAWVVEGLSDGSILIITTKEPWDGYESRLPADDHLLDDGEK